ncbi:MAG: hypothetical protein A2Y40_05030 [Candidatus Margulisbacteria bacterium GWF2_35_9]|nr:MAG: hypothetical protein A2Y40_05030 [Candidatus Margulisbacteria bacterium GWF2_35_9]
MSNKSLILVVEDEKDMAEHIKNTLVKTDRYEVLNAYDGEEGLAVFNENSRFFGFAKNRIKCIVLDLKMPKMNGLQFLKEIRNNEYCFTRLPVIILSAYEDQDKWLEVTSVVSGMVCHYLKKPFKKIELLSIIDRAVNYEMEYMIDETKKRLTEKMDELRGVEIVEI